MTEGTTGIAPASEDGAWTLAGRRALVTGGSRGIGRAVVEEFLALGAQVLVVARNADDLSSAIQMWQHDGHSVRGIAADMSEEGGRAAVAEAVAQDSEAGLDILVNNAGGNRRKPTLEYTTSEVDQVLQLNLISAFELSRLLHPFLARAAQRRQVGGSAVVNMSSIAGVVAIRSGVPYGMSKAAMSHMTRALAGEWAKDGIRVNAIAPWYIRTPAAATALEDEALAGEIIARTPMQRVGEAREVATLAAFLAMGASSYVTGQIVAVDGGFTAWSF